MSCCFCEEYRSLYDSQYYKSIGKKIGFPSRILAETNNWYAIPTIGSFVPGYLLLVCKQHELSMATLSLNLRDEMFVLKERMEERISQVMGCRCLMFEHGTTDSNYIGVNSVNHVHIHLVPSIDSVWVHLSKENSLFDFEVFDDYSNLFMKWEESPPKTYLLFQDADKKIYYSSDVVDMPSQLFRRCLASIWGLSEWDWRKYPCSYIIRDTLRLFGRK